MLFIILGSFCSFLDWEGTDIQPRQIPEHIFKLMGKKINIKGGLPSATEATVMCLISPPQMRASR